MNDSISVISGIREGTVCVGVDAYGEEELDIYLDSEHYMVTEGVLTFNAREGDSERMVDLKISVLDESDFLGFVAPSGLREVTDTSNNTLIIRGASRIGGYSVLEYGLADDDLGLPVAGYDHARFRAFQSEDLLRFEVALVLMP